MTSPDLYLAAIEQALRPLANAASAMKMRAYLLDQFAFLGLPAPVRRAAVKRLGKLRWDCSAEVLAAAQLLWCQPEREYRYTAIDLLRQQRRFLRSADLPAIRQLLQRDAWWETVDGLSAVIGAIVRAERATTEVAQATMDRWITDADLWVRRAAMLHQLGWRLDTDAERLFTYAQQLAGEKNVFIRKAIGWALRDYARWNPQAVSRFLRHNAEQFSALTLREAQKHLAASQ